MEPVALTHVLEMSVGVYRREHNDRVHTFTPRVICDFCLASCVDTFDCLLIKAPVGAIAILLFYDSYNGHNMLSSLS